jgi:thymidylate synthase ThyX
MEELEKFRLCSYTEKSQRYITLDKDYVLPEEIKGGVFEKDFLGVVHLQNEAYADFLGRLKEYVFASNPELAGDEKNTALLEGWAKEDARYITSLSTSSQVGLTLNARNLELMLRRFASHPLHEVRSLGANIYSVISGIAPSIVIFHEANQRDKNTYRDLREESRSIMGKSPSKDNIDGDKVSLEQFTPDADEELLASMLFSSSGRSYRDCRETAAGMSHEEKMRFFKASWRNMQFYDSMLREYEFANLTYSIILSSACFGQLKRHRMATLVSQDYDPVLGITVPSSVRSTGLEERFLEVSERSEELYSRIMEVSPVAAPYILTNAHRRRVLMRINARELYHISRLREDSHAQWDIRNVAGEMVEKAKEKMPLTFALAGGKDSYNEIYRQIFGELPAVKQAVLPSSRKISA